MVFFKCWEKQRPNGLLWHDLEWHVNNIFEAFFQEWTAEEKSYMYFQQDSAPAHTAENSVWLDGSFSVNI